MINKNRKTICVTGVDGSGKSTLIKGLASALAPVHVATIWDLLETGSTHLPFKSKQEVDNYLCSLTPNSRLLFLAHAMQFSIDVAYAQEHTILIDSYYYKYFATELAYGASENLVTQLISHLPKPDTVIQLVVAQHTATKRKEFYSRYESGLSATPNHESFAKFQKTVADKWKIFNTNNWLSISAEQAPEAVLKETLQKLSI